MQVFVDAGVAVDDQTVLQLVRSGVRSEVTRVVRELAGKEEDR